MHPSNKPTLEALEELFTYHKPNAGMIPRFAAISAAAKEFAKVVLENCPDCADRSFAVRLIGQARMTANASVACDPDLNKDG